MGIYTTRRRILWLLMIEKINTVASICSAAVTEISNDARKGQTLWGTIKSCSIPELYTQTTDGSIDQSYNNILNPQFWGQNYSSGQFIALFFCLYTIYKTPPIYLYYCILLCYSQFTSQWGKINETSVACGCITAQNFQTHYFF